MTFYSSTGSFSSPTSSPYTTTVSNLGFTPVAIILWSSTSNATGWTANDGVGMSFAAKNGSTMQFGCSTAAGQNGVTTTKEKSTFGAAPVSQRDYTGTIQVNASDLQFSSSNNGQFTVTWSTHNYAWKFHYLVLGGTDLTNAGVVSYLTPVGAASKAVTGLGFKPDLVILITTGGYTSSGSIASVGAMDKDGNQWAVSSEGKGNIATSQTRRHQITTACTVNMQIGTTVGERAYYTSMDNDGFTVYYDVSSGGGGDTVYCLCLKGPQFKVGTFNKSTSAAPTTDQVTTTGIDPTAVIAATISSTASSSVQTGGRIMLGVSDGTGNHIVGGNKKNAVTTNVEYCYEQTAYSLAVADNDSQSTEATGTLGSFAAGSFTASWDTNTAVATQICYIAMGELAGADATPTVSTLSTSTSVIQPNVVTQSNVAVTPSTVASSSVVVTPTINLYDVDGAIVTNCVVEYIGDSFPASGVTIDNVGSLGADCDGTATDNDIVTLPSGAPAFAMNDATDTITIPENTGIDNFTNITLEFLIKVGSDVNDGVYALLEKDAWMCQFATWGGGTVEMFHYNESWGQRKASAASCGMTAGNLYFIQITWDNNPTSTAVIKLNNVSKTVTMSGTATTWQPDSSASAHLMKAWGDSHDHTIALFRWHSEKLSDANLTTNHNASKWRYQNVGASLSALETTVDVVPPTAIVSTDVAVTVTTLPTVVSSPQPTVSVQCNVVVTPHACTSGVIQPTISIVSNVAVTANTLTAATGSISPLVSVNDNVGVTTTVNAVTSSVAAPSVSIIDSVSIFVTTNTTVSNVSSPSVSISDTVGVTASTVNTASSITTPSVTVNDVVGVTTAALGNTAVQISTGIPSTTSVITTSVLNNTTSPVITEIPATASSIIASSVGNASEFIPATVSQLGQGITTITQAATGGTTQPTVSIEDVVWVTSTAIVTTSSLTHPSVYISDTVGVTTPTISNSVAVVSVGAPVTASVITTSVVSTSASPISIGIPVTSSVIAVSPVSSNSGFIPAAVSQLEQSLTTTTVAVAGVVTQPTISIGDNVELTLTTISNTSEVTPFAVSISDNLVVTTSAISNTIATVGVEVPTTTSIITTSAISNTVSPVNASVDTASVVTISTLSAATTSVSTELPTTTIVITTSSLSNTTASINVGYPVTTSVITTSTVGTATATVSIEVPATTSDIELPSLSSTSETVQAALSQLDQVVTLSPLVTTSGVVLPTVATEDTVGVVVTTLVSTGSLASPLVSLNDNVVVTAYTLGSSSALVGVGTPETASFITTSVITNTAAPVILGIPATASVVTLGAISNTSEILPADVSQLGQSLISSVLSATNDVPPPTVSAGSNVTIIMSDSASSLVSPTVSINDLVGVTIPVLSNTIELVSAENPETTSVITTSVVSNSVSPISTEVPATASVITVSAVGSTSEFTQADVSQLGQSLIVPPSQVTSELLQPTTSTEDNVGVVSTTLGITGELTSPSVSISDNVVILASTVGLSTGIVSPMQSTISVITATPVSSSSLLSTVRITQDIDLTLTPPDAQCTYGQSEVQIDVATPTLIALSSIATSTAPTPAVSIPITTVTVSTVVIEVDAAVLRIDPAIPVLETLSNVSAFAQPTASTEDSISVIVSSLSSDTSAVSAEVSRADTIVPLLTTLATSSLAIVAPSVRLDVILPALSVISAESGYTVPSATVSCTPPVLTTLGASTTRIAPDLTVSVSRTVDTLEETSSYTQQVIDVSVTLVASPVTAYSTDTDLTTVSRADCVVPMCATLESNVLNLPVTVSTERNTYVSVETLPLSVDNIGGTTITQVSRADCGLLTSTAMASTVSTAAPAPIISVARTPGTLITVIDNAAATVATGVSRADSIVTTATLSAALEVVPPVQLSEDNVLITLSPLFSNASVVNTSVSTADVVALVLPTLPTLVPAVITPVVRVDAVTPALLGVAGASECISPRVVIDCNPPVLTTLGSITGNTSLGISSGTNLNPHTVSATSLSTLALVSRADCLVPSMVPVSTTAILTQPEFALGDYITLTLNTLSTALNPSITTHVARADSMLPALPTLINSVVNIPVVVSTVDNRYITLATIPITSDNTGGVTWTRVSRADSNVVTSTAVASVLTTAPPAYSISVTRTPSTLISTTGNAATTVLTGVSQSDAIVPAITTVMGSATALPQTITSIAVGNIVQAVGAVAGVHVIPDGTYVSRSDAYIPAVSTVSAVVPVLPHPVVLFPERSAAVSLVSLEVSSTVLTPTVQVTGLVIKVQTVVSTAGVTSPRVRIWVDIYRRFGLLGTLQKNRLLKGSLEQIWNLRGSRTPDTVFKGSKVQMELLRGSLEEKASYKGD